MPKFATGISNLAGLFLFKSVGEEPSSIEALIKPLGVGGFCSRSLRPDDGDSFSGEDLQKREEETLDEGEKTGEFVDIATVQDISFFLFVLLCFCSVFNVRICESGD